MRRAFELILAVVLVPVLACMVQAEETKGTIKAVDSGRNEVVLKGVVKDSIYELNKDATVWLDGARCKLGDLRTDDHVVVTYEKQGDHMKASMVRGLRKAQEATGTVNDVLLQKQEITLTGTVKNTTYELIKGGTVWVDARAGKLGDIHPGDRVLITYEQRGDRWMANDVTLLKRK
jgi:hypothetical protein